LISTTATFIERFSYWPTFALLAARATKAIWPAQLKKIVPTSFFGGKARLKLGNRSGIVFDTARYYILGAPDSSEYPHFDFSAKPIRREEVTAICRKSPRFSTFW
jgi:hypothetical protein